MTTLKQTKLKSGKDQTTLTATCEMDAVQSATKNTGAGIIQGIGDTEQSIILLSQGGFIKLSQGGFLVRSNA